MSLRRSTAAGLAALALVSLAACGKSHDAGQAHSTAAGSASSGATASAGASGALAAKLQKVITDGKSAHVDLDLGTAGKGSGVIAFAGSKPALDLTISGGQAGSAEVRLVDGVMYLKSSMAGQKWLKLDAAAAASSGFDPSNLLDQLKNIKGGTDLGNGHWQVDEGNGVTADIYFNSDGTLHKSVVNRSGAAPITVTYSDWGTKVDVQAPPKDQVMDMPNLSAPSIPSQSPQ